MAIKTNAQLTEELKLVSQKIDTLQTTINQLIQNVNSRPKLSDLSRVEALLQESIGNNSELINDLDRKLATVILPEDTQYYLEQTEVATFRSNFSKLLAMIAKFEKLYSSLVAYAVNIDTSV